MILETPLPHLSAIELPTPFPVGPVMVYLAHAPGEPLTLIDTGPCTPETEAALVTALAELGHTPADVERILITHAHEDHFGLAADLVAASGAQVLTHIWNRTALEHYESDQEQRHRFYADLLQKAGVPLQVRTFVGQVTRNMRRFARSVAVEVVLNDGDVVHLAGHDWQVLYMPGHATGLICLYEPLKRLLISSDHLLADISSNPVVEPPLPGQTERPRSLALYQQSLSRIAVMDIAQALPGHGPVIEDVPGLVRQRFEFHRKRLSRIWEVLRQKACTTWEITLALFPDCGPLDTFLAVSEVIGHLDLLEMEGRISGEVIDGVQTWRVTQDERQVPAS